MGIGFSLILLAAGAILAFAVDAEVAGLDINAVGAILMVVGAIGLLLSLLFWSSLGSYGFGSHRTVSAHPRSTGHVYESQPDVQVERPRYREVERTVTRDAPEPRYREVERTTSRQVREDDVIDDTHH